MAEPFSFLQTTNKNATYPEPRPVEEAKYLIQRRSDIPREKNQEENYSIVCYTKDSTRG